MEVHQLPVFLHLLSCNNSKVANFTNSRLTISSAKSLNCNGALSTNTLTASGAPLQQNTKRNGNLELLETGASSTCNGCITLGNSQNPNSGSWGTMHHKLVNIRMNANTIHLIVRVVLFYLCFCVNN